MNIKLEALDTLFFRDGKPFAMGDETWADGYTLPSPSVLYGALRTAIAVENGIQFHDIEQQLDNKQFRIQQIYYRIGGKTALPLPFDLVEYPKNDLIKDEEKRNQLYEVKPLKVYPNKSSISSSLIQTADYFLAAADLMNQTVATLTDAMIEVSELEKYLKGELTATQALKLADYIFDEPKVGIGRDNSTKVSDEGKLYRVDMKRYQDIQVGLSYELDQQQKGLNKVACLGGEGKMVTVSSQRRKMNVISQNIPFENNRFKLYFATPAILENGKPNFLQKNKHFKNVKLVAASVAKPISLGGFDIQKRKPKVMYRVIPAGSVFYYESSEEVSDLLNAWQGHSFSDKLQAQGFGIAYFGKWNAK